VQGLISTLQVNLFIAQGSEARLIFFLVDGWQLLQQLLKRLHFLQHLNQLTLNERMHADP